MSTNDKNRLATPLHLESNSLIGKVSPVAATLDSGKFAPSSSEPALHQDIPPPLKRWQTLPLPALRAGPFHRAGDPAAWWQHWYIELYQS